MKWEISTRQSINYMVKTSNDIFNPANRDVIIYSTTGDGRSDRGLVVVDKKVFEIYGDKIKNYFLFHKLKTRIVIIDGVESKKNTDSLFMLLHEMEQFGILRRNECIIGIGGGVVLDVVGLAASLYRRGVPYMRIPTTLLGIVDVSIAAKTAVNFENRRNRLGSYYPPVCSLLDKTFIKTQEPKEISSGLGEILKMAVIKNSLLFSTLEDYGAELLDSKFDHPLADEVIGMAVQGMKEELENNLFETNLRRCVDFGHSFSPIIEMRSLQTAEPLTHGQAVVLDIILSCILAQMWRLLNETDVNRIKKVAIGMGLLISHPMFKDVALLLESLNDTKKHRGGIQNLPMPNGIGRCTFVNNLTFEEICQVAGKI